MISKTKCDYPKNRGFWVRSPTVSKLFTVNRHGSWDAAESAAETFIIHHLKSHPEEMQVPFIMNKSRRNVSGRIGVYRTIQNGHPCWVANTAIGPRGKRCDTRFSCHKYGEDGAFRLALAVRDGWERAVRENRVDEFWKSIGRS